MSQIDPAVPRYLQMRARLWLAEDPKREQVGLAKLAKVNRERISVLLSSGAVGYDIAQKIGKAFGFPSMSELLPAATEWARNEPEAPAPASKVRLPQNPADRLALIAALAEEADASEAAIMSVFAERPEGQPIFRVLVRIARRDLEIADGTVAPPVGSAKRAK